MVCLKDEDGENHWFIMDAEKDVFTPYQEYSSQYNRYIITAVPDGVAIPDGFKETTLKIGDNSVIVISLMILQIRICILFMRSMLRARKAL